MLRRRSDRDGYRRDITRPRPREELAPEQANELVTCGELRKRFQEIIAQQKSRPAGALRARICPLALLIDKLSRERADIGVGAAPSKRRRASFLGGVGRRRDADRGRLTLSFSRPLDNRERTLDAAESA
jgi:hypothetical protein